MQVHTQVLSVESGRNEDGCSHSEIDAHNEKLVEYVQTELEAAVGTVAKQAAIVFKHPVTIELRN